MKKQLIAIDMDGTLLNEKSEISPLTFKTLVALQTLGHLIVLTSGRPLRSILRYYRYLNLSAPLIAYNGMLLLNPSDQNFRGYSKPFEKEKVIRIYQSASPYLISAMAESLDRFYLLHDDSYLFSYFPYEKEKTTYGPLEKTIKEDVWTALFHIQESHYPFLLEASNSEGYGLRHWTNSPYAECYIPGYDKGFALSYLLKELHYKKEDVWAFGDADNDYNFLLNSGHPFVMKNSKSSLLKETFPSTEKGHQEDGVAFTLIKYFSDLEQLL